jgi:hypothetical protein
MLRKLIENISDFPDAGTELVVPLAREFPVLPRTSQLPPAAPVTVVDQRNCRVSVPLMVRRIFQGEAWSPRFRRVFRVVAGATTTLLGRLMVDESPRCLCTLVLFVVGFLLCPKEGLLPRRKMGRARNAMWRARNFDLWRGIFDFIFLGRTSAVYVEELTNKIRKNVIIVYFHLRAE